MRTGIVALSMLVATFAAGCGGETTPVAQQATAPSPVASGGETLAPYGGTWMSGPDGSATSTGTCTNLQWRLPGMTGTTGTGTFVATCNGVQLTGTVTVAMGPSSSLDWRVAGRTTQSGRPCEYSLRGTATMVRAGGMKVDYSGTVCGTPVSGSQVWQRS